MTIEGREPLGPLEYQEAAERGRLLAVGVLLDSEDKRKELVDVFGLGYCQRRYPEVYRDSQVKACKSSR